MKSATCNPMRILVVGRFNSIHTRRFAEELGRQGAEVAGLCLTASAEKPDLPCYQPARTPRILGLPKTATIASLFYLRRAINDFRPDVIHVQDDIRLVKWLHLTRPRGVKLAYTTWGHYPQRVLADAGFRRSLRGASLVVSDARDVLDEIVPFAPSARQEIMRFGADLAHFSPGRPDAAVLAQHGLSSSGKYILSPRSLRPSYNQLTLIRALPAVVRVAPEVKVILKHHHVENYEDSAGYESQVRIEAERLGVWEHVVRLDHLPFEHLCHLYRASRVAVSIPLMDGFPASIFEAMAVGCPLVVSNDRSYEGVIEDGVNAISIEPTDDEALAAALIRVFQDERLFDRLREQGFRTVKEKGDFVHEVGRLMRTYEQLLNAN